MSAQTDGLRGCLPLAEPSALNPEALHTLCVGKLAGYKRPTSITVMDAIPKNAVRKTDKAPFRAAHLKGQSL